MKKMMRTLFLLSLTMLLVQGCGGSDSEQADSNQGEPGQQATGSADPGKVVVTVNGTTITDGELDHETDLIMRQYAGRVSPDQIQAMASSMRTTAMTNIVNRTLLRQAADREGIPASEEEIDGRIDQIKGNFPDEEAFVAQLESSGLTMDSFRHEIEYTIKLETLMDRMTQGIEKTDETKAREFYDSNTERFVKPEQIRASHVLLKVDPSESEEAKAAKRSSIEDIHTRLAGGEDFATVASEHSDCPSASNGGDLGMFGRGQMVKPFEDAAFALGLNELSGVVETRFGFHVIKVTEKTEGGMTPFEEVSADIVQYLDGTTRQQELEKYVTALRDLATIEYADSAGQ